MARHLQLLRKQVMYVASDHAEVIISPRNRSEVSYEHRRLGSLLGGSEQMLYRLRRNYVNQVDVSSRAPTYDSFPLSKVKNHSSGPHKSRTKPRTYTHSALSHPTPPPHDSKKLTKLPATSQKKFTTIQLNADLPLTGSSLALERLKNWISYQQESSVARKNTRPSPRSCAQVEIKPDFPEINLEAKSTRRQKSYEVTPETERIYVRFERKEEKGTEQLLVSPLGLAKPENAGFPKAQPLKMSRRTRLSPSRSLDKSGTDQLLADLPPAQLPDVPSLPRLRKVYRPPAHTLPGYRVPVEYNQYRSVYRHRAPLVYPS